MPRNKVRLCHSWAQNPHGFSPPRSPQDSLINSSFLLQLTGVVEWFYFYLQLNIRTTIYRVLRCVSGAALNLTMLCGTRTGHFLLVLAMWGHWVTQGTTVSTQPWMWGRIFSANFQCSCSEAAPRFFPGTHGVPQLSQSPRPLLFTLAHGTPPTPAVTTGSLLLSPLCLRLPVSVRLWVGPYHSLSRPCSGPPSIWLLPSPTS